MFQGHKPMLTLHVGGESIRTTTDHPFFVEGKGWMNAADLHPGDPLLSHDASLCRSKGSARAVSKKSCTT